MSDKNKKAAPAKQKAQPDREDMAKSSLKRSLPGRTVIAAAKRKNSNKNKEKAAQSGQVKPGRNLAARALEAEMQTMGMGEVMIIPFGGNLRRVLFWLGVMVFFALFLFVFADILLPFVAGFVLAYFLNPIVEFCERIGISRLWATVMIVLVAVIVLAAALILLVPVLSEQLFGVIKNLPDYFSRLQNIFAHHDTKWLRQYIGIDISNLQSSVSSLLGQAANLLKTILPSLWSSSKALMGMATLMVVTPVVAFYMLLDWQKMVGAVDSWIPRNRLQTVHAIVWQMNRAVAGFIRGQGTLCLILGCYYAVMLTLCGVNFSLLIGLFIGLIAFIPYVGSTIGLLLSAGMACIQYWPEQWPWIAAVVGVFLVGQFLEGYVLQPKLVGSSVGLHPVWLMFALFAFGSLFGFTGMLIAVPAAAAIGVLVRFALHSYLTSVFYEGEGNKG
nr:AI-2E family transporter [Candidatus Tokpelaia sp.]